MRESSKKIIMIGGADEASAKIIFASEF